MNWIWFHKLGSPKWFFHWADRWSKLIFIFGVSLFLLGIIWGLVFAPEDYQQGNSFRIIYIHVPSAMLAQSCYLALGISGIVSLVWQMKMAPIFIKSVAPIGAVMAIIALLSGAIWGKPTWGTWWVWDARLTSVLVLFILYMGVIAIQNSFDDTRLSDKAAVVISVVGLINLPIIKYSVDWWNTLHQPASINILSTSTAIHTSMLIPLGIMTAAFALFSLLIFLMKYNTELIKVKNKGLDRL